MHVIIKIYERSVSTLMCNKYTKEVLFKHYLVLISIYKALTARKINCSIA